MPLTSRQAIAADAFVDSIGINTHYGQQNYVVADFPRLNSLILQSGVRHIRDSAYIAGTQPAACANAATLGASGIRFDFITSLGMTPADINAWNACVGQAVDRFEPYNEYDLFHGNDPDWPSTSRAFQKTLYDTIKANPSTNGVRVLGPALTSGDAETLVGPLPNFLDEGNVHGFFAGFSPENTGFGANGYGSLEYNLVGPRLIAGTKPLVVTETGYSTANIKNSVDIPTQAKYLQRVFFYQITHGVTRTYMYELNDEPETLVNFANDGLIDTAGTPKPSYVNLKNTIGLLADAGSAVPTDTLTYGIDGDNTDVQTTLLQKRNGDYYMAIWIAAPSYDTNALKVLPVPTRNVKLVLPYAPTSATVYSFDARGNMSSVGVSPAQSLPLTISDTVEIVRFPRP
ncbi:MAG: hypothetical protein NVS3B28_26740 [Candidatus Velthaea sp.]